MKGLSSPSQILDYMDQCSNLIKAASYVQRVRQRWYDPEQPGEFCFRNNSPLNCSRIVQNIQTQIQRIPHACKILLHMHQNYLLSPPPHPAPPPAKFSCYVTGIFQDLNLRREGRIIILLLSDPHAWILAICPMFRI